MSRRIEIELTSKRPDGTWTWRAAGAREPRGIVEDALVPAGVKENDVLRADVETDLDGTRVLAMTPPKGKTARTGLLEFIPSEKPFEPVTQQLRKKGGRDGDKKRGPRRDRPTGDRPRGDRRQGDASGEGRTPRPDRPRRPFFEAPPELPQRPKPKRVRPQRHNVVAVLSELPEAHRAIAEKVLNGGVPAVRAAIEEQNKAAVTEGREKVPAEGLIQIAEQLLPRLRVAEWRDKASAAETIIEDIDLRDLRSIVVSSDQLVAIDEQTRALVVKMKQALVVRQETETKNWLDDISAASKVGRVVRALRLSSQPPKAGVPFPPALAQQLVEATVAGLTPDAPAERWIALLEAAAFSPVHAKVIPAAAPEVVPDELRKTIVRLGPLMPQVAALFGVEVDPKARAPRPLQAPRPDKGPRKKAAELNKEKSPRPATSPKSKAASVEPKSKDQAPADQTSVPVEGTALSVETPVPVEDTEISVVSPVPADGAPVVDESATEVSATEQE